MGSGLSGTPASRVEIRRIWAWPTQSFGHRDDQSALVLYGTGIRGQSSLANVTVTIGTVTLPVQYAGPCDPAQFVAFDQVNVALPQSLAGAGQVTVTLTVDGVAAPPVTLDFE